MESNWRIVLRSLAKPLGYLLSALMMCVCASAFADATAAAAAADTTSSSTGLGGVATTVKGNLSAIAQLITAGSYIAGFAFGVAAIVKFKAHKDNPTQVMISQPIVLLFVAAALIFIPSVFKTTGDTLFSSPTQATVSGVTSF